MPPLIVLGRSRILSPERSQPMMSSTYGSFYLHRVLKAHNWLHKVARKAAKEWSKELRAMWCTKASRWPQCLLCSIDESAAHEKTGYPKYSCSPVGVDCVDLQSTKQFESWSILPALAIYRYLEGTKMVQGATTADVFNDWLQDTILPQLRPGMIHPSL